MGAFREYFGDFCFAREKRRVFFSLFFFAGGVL